MLLKKSQSTAKREILRGLLNFYFGSCAWPANSSLGLGWWMLGRLAWPTAPPSLDAIKTAAQCIGFQWPDDHHPK